MHHLTVITIAFALEALLSYPKPIYKYIKHPVVWMGAVIGALDRNFNNSLNPLSLREIVRIRGLGITTMLILLTLTISTSLLISIYTGAIGEIIAIASLLATRNLYDHVNAVYKSLSQNDLENSRTELAKIVGRDTENLDSSETNKASIETLAESFNDGVVAPLFWACLFGLSGIAAYKAINTADSMIGHKTERYRYFGWAAARLDDLLNFIPARLSAILITICHPMLIAKSNLIAKEAKKHASPNSGYPEAAMAYALAVQLGGKRSYDGKEYSAPLIGEELRKEIFITDLQKALKIYVTICVILFTILLISAILQY
ncbi:MAG: adenosylcobinamide-phosphate synthase CbiB [Rickettsiales bacterium]